MEKSKRSDDFGTVYASMKIILLSRGRVIRWKGQHRQIRGIITIPSGDIQCMTIGYRKCGHRKELHETFQVM